MKFMSIAPGYVKPLTRGGVGPEAVHVFGQDEIDAINAALAARRPLLVRGEPGIGKSQLARAAAAVLGRAFLQQVVDARTESRDLLWHYDAVARLAQAQLLGALGRSDSAACLDISSLAVESFLHPQVMWWAFNWEEAQRQARQVRQPEPPQPDGGDYRNGCLVLIDEIDKAETDVPRAGPGRWSPPVCPPW